ncbi:MAG: DUF2062 domain-containing protein [Proteobacteria bacterium]|nr:DUF2062 domain-containing protein [Pseudomonadota bacterium]
MSKSLKSRLAAWLHVPKGRRRGVHSRRRKTQSEQLWELLWPSMGWKAFARLVWLKLQRQAEDPHKVALGVAVGVGISFWPIPGLGIATSVLLAWIFRANIAAAVVGQMVGNPWTFPLIFWSTYELGKHLWPVHKAMNPNVMEHGLSLQFVWANLGTLAHNVFMPMVIGGTIMGLIFATLAYYTVYWEVEKFWQLRRARMAGKKK